MDDYELKVSSISHTKTTTRESCRQLSCIDRGIGAPIHVKDGVLVVKKSKFKHDRQNVNHTDVDTGGHVHHSSHHLLLSGSNVIQRHDIIMTPNSALLQKNSHNLRNVHFPSIHHIRRDQSSLTFPFCADYVERARIFTQVLWGSHGASVQALQTLLTRHFKISRAIVEPFRTLVANICEAHRELSLYSDDPFTPQTTMPQSPFAQ